MLLPCIVQNSSSWIPQLLTLGYCNPLFIPTPFIQAMLACIADPDLHKIIVDHDLIALTNDSPFILLTASVNDWLMLLNFANSSPSSLVDKLKKLISFLPTMEHFDAKEMDLFKSLLPRIAEKLVSINSSSNPPSPVSTASLAVPSNGLIDPAFLSVADKALMSNFSPISPTPRSFSRNFFWLFFDLESCNSFEKFYVLVFHINFLIFCH